MLVKLIIASLYLLLLAGMQTSSHASETRGLRVVAKDLASGQSGEVKLYNKSYAVIIGIDKYPNLPHDRQLSYAVKDAKGVEQVLKQQYKFDRIITLYDQQATKSRILELLTDELPTQMGEEDSLFIFWAGHGNQEKKSDGDLGYLIPFDGKMGKLTTVITMDEIKNTISKAVPAKHVFYVFDACYSGLLTTRAVDTKSRRDLVYLKEITRERVRQVLTAGGKGQEVLDSGRNGHSVFTGRLIEVLEAKDDFVTANEIQAIIREKVSGDARARGYKQTPAYDAISGSGDYVFVPFSQDRLIELSAASAVRQKEFEWLRKVEREAAIAKQMERAEVVKKEAELAALDKQISEMKGRLGTGSARSSDSLDAIVLMAEQKEQQGRQLDELRKQRENEEKRRQIEITRIKQEAETKRVEQVKADFEKYQKVATSKYAQDMKEAAWKALVSSYPEITSVALGDIDQALIILGVQKLKPNFKSNYIQSDSRLPSGNLLIKDSITGLMWPKNGNIANKMFSHYEAELWVKKLDYAGFSDWRLPTERELSDFVNNKIKTNKSSKPDLYYIENCFYLTSTQSSNRHSISSWVIGIPDGYRWDGRNYDKVCAWPVRSGR